MLRGEARRTRWLRLSCCLLLAGWCWSPGVGAGARGGPPPLPDLDAAAGGEWGSGSFMFHDEEFLHGSSSQFFPADGPLLFMESPEGEPAANCTERFWLPAAPPSSTSGCQDAAAAAGPEEFQKSRLLVLQNRAALQAVSTSSGVEEGGASYQQQAREEVHGVLSDHRSVQETVDTVTKVFISLQEKRREGGEQRTFSSMKEQMASTRDAMDHREYMFKLLEKQFSSLEKSLLTMQHRLQKLLAH